MKKEFHSNKSFISQKKYYLLVMLLSLLLTTNKIIPQYIVELSNSSLVNDHTYEFEINIKSTGVDFELTSYQFALSFNPGIENGGTLSFSYIPGTSEFTNLPTNGVGVLNDREVDLLCFASSVGSDIISDTNKRIGRFRIQNTVSFELVSINLTWNFTGNIITILTGSGYSNITVPQNFNSPDDRMPVELTNFKVSLENDFVHLKWETETEVKVWGFEVQRVFQSTTDNPLWEKIGFVNGYGNSTSTKYYNFKDLQIEKSGTYKYRLRMIDLDGSYTYSDEVEIEVIKPKKFNLLQNYPNPFNPSTRIKYSVQNESIVKLSVYNSLGELVETLVNTQQPSGNYEIAWNAINLASGIYFYRMEAIGIDGKDNFIATNKMQLLK